MRSAIQIIANACGLFFVMCFSVQASDKIYYGSRSGMTVSVVSRNGIDTSKSTIKVKHARDDAIGFCRDYILKVTPSCIARELKTKLHETVSADCSAGEFSNFYGERHRFEGKSKVSSQSMMMANYNIRNLDTGEIADGSSASGYSTNMGIFRALCPSKAPAENEE